jgi:hypothetical protein
MKKFTFYKNRSLNKAKTSICQLKLNRFKDHNPEILFLRNKEINKLFSQRINNFFNLQEYYILKHPNKPILLLNSHLKAYYLKKKALYQRTLAHK